MRQRTTRPTELPEIADLANAERDIRRLLVRHPGDRHLLRMLGRCQQSQAAARDLQTDMDSYGVAVEELDATGAD